MRVGTGAERRDRSGVDVDRWEVRGRGLVKFTKGGEDPGEGVTEVIGGSVEPRAGRGSASVAKQSKQRHCQRGNQRVRSRDGKHAH